jgi:uncharacterized protein DUF6221
MSEDLVAFLNARLDEDERIALAATPGPWHAQEDAVFAGSHRPPGYSRGIAITRASYTGSILDHSANATHIAYHDPASVLREVATKRAIIGSYQALAASEDTSRWHEGELFAMEAVVRWMAAIWSDHPNYRQEWKP